MPRARHRWSPVCDPPQGLVRPVRIDPAGVDGPTRGQARGPGWRQTSYGHYAPSAVPRTVEQRILEMSVLLPEGGAVTGWASLRLHLANFFDGLAPDGATELPVPLVVGPGRGRRQRDDVRWLEDRLDPDEVTVIHGIPVTTVRRAAFDAMRLAPDVREATVAMDMAAAAGLVSIARMRAYLLTREGWTGVPQVRAALDLADEDSRSPNETRMRLIWVLDAGLPPPMVNKPVFDLTGRLIAIIDLLDFEAGVAGEFDGADHRAAMRHSRDVFREEDCRRHGLEYFKVTGPDLGSVPLVVDRMVSTRSRALWLPPERCRWTIVAPPWWTPDPPLDYLLDMREEAERWEREGPPDLRDIIGGPL